MSYLPRMSKTYKEPEERPQEEPAQEITFNSLPIASALPDDKACNPQSILKQYSYYPHPPPHLPGPSVLHEAEQNEKITMEAKRRRSRNVIETKQSVSAVEEANDDGDRKIVNYALMNVPTLEVGIDPEPPLSPNMTVRDAKVQGKTAEGKPVKNKEDSSKVRNVVQSESGESDEQVSEPEVNVAQIFDPPSDRSQAGLAEVDPAIKKAKESKSPVKYDTLKLSSLVPEICNVMSSKRGVSDEGIQCSAARTGENLFVMPVCVHSLIKTLAFLIQELDKNDEGEDGNQPKEVKKLIRQIDEIVTELSEHKVDSRFELQTSISDTKRLERICNDLENYIQEIYGENGRLGCKSKEKKRISCDLFQRDCELKILNEKLRETDIQNPNLKTVEHVAKAPEIVLQNKDLENEQLLAEIQFNSQELTRYQRALAEKCWEIQRSKDEITELKRKFTMLKIKSRKDVNKPRPRSRDLEM